MNYSNKLDLNYFFRNFETEKYCIVKLNNDFPNYYECSDIDIFSIDIKKLTQKILYLSEKYVKNGFRIEISEVNQEQIFVDFYFDDKLDFRFDLYQSIPHYKNIEIKMGFFNVILENRVVEQIQNENISYYVYVPALKNDLMLRYFEYLEWYSIRPDKIKHVDFIKAKVKSEEEWGDLLSEMYCYVSFPTNFDRYIKERSRADSMEFFFLLKKINEQPLYRLPMRSFKFFKRKVLEIMRK